MIEQDKFQWPTPFLGRIGNVLAYISMPITFLGMMYAACNSAGWVVGIALGWIPAILATVVVAGVVACFWWLVPLVCAAALLLHYF